LYQLEKEIFELYQGTDSVALFDLHVSQHTLDSQPNPVSTVESTSQT